jgi:T4 RnlA family RNA ligase
MNTSQKQLYQDLISVASDSKKDSPFYYVDQETENECFYRIFGYFLTTETDWEVSQNTFWSRGTMFLLDKNKSPIKLICLPMKKFFNLNENKFSAVSNRILNENIVVTEKLDGSLMSTYIDQNGALKLKSKMSIKSEHCEKAMDLLNSNKYKDLKHALLHATAVYHHTVDLEWTSPNNRIVLGYTTDSLTVLSAQCRNTLAIVNPIGALQPWVVHKPRKDVLQTVKDSKGIEGYVIEFEDKTRVKIKSDWYSALHRTKDIISTPKNLYEACLGEQVDDLISMFIGDEATLNQIKTMQDRAKNDFYQLKGTCDAFHFTNKDLNRKDYALKGQEVLARHEFGIVMNLYCNKNCDYVKVLLDIYE